MSALVSRLRVLADGSRKVYGLHAADCAAAMDEAASQIELLEAAGKASESEVAVITSGFRNAAAEIERLRAELSGARHRAETGQPALTDAEREALTNTRKWMLYGNRHGVEEAPPIIDALLKRHAKGGGA